MIYSNTNKTALIYIDKDGNQVTIDGGYLGLVGITKNLSDHNENGDKFHLIHTFEKKE